MIAENVKTNKIPCSEGVFTPFWKKMGANKNMIGKGHNIRHDLNQNEKSYDTHLWSLTINLNYEESLWIYSTLKIATA